MGLTGALVDAGRTDALEAAAGLLCLSGFTINLAPLPALALDLVGRRLAGSGAGLLSVPEFYQEISRWPTEPAYPI